MRALARFFWELVSVDPWRKLGAIGLAIFLWLYVHQRITGEKVFSLEIRATTLNSWESDPGFLYVKVPKGKILQLYPAPNNQISVTLRGTNRELASLTGPLTAFFDPADDRGEMKADSIGVPSDRIHWDRPQIAGLLKSINPERFVLNFENIERTEIVLKPEGIDIQGSPPNGFVVHREHAQFLPSALLVTGPRPAIEKLKKGEFLSLFRPLTIRKDDTSSPQSFALELNEDLQRQGLSLESRSALALIPIRPKTTSLKFRARIFLVAAKDGGTALLDAYRLQGSAEGRNWTEAEWIAEVPDTLAPEVTETWIQNHVRFLVDLGAIERPDEISSTEIEVRQVLQHLAAGDYARFSSIQFRPADPGRAKMIVERKPANASQPK